MSTGLGTKLFFPEMHKNNTLQSSNHLLNRQSHVYNLQGQSVFVNDSCIHSHETEKMCQ